MESFLEVSDARVRYGEFEVLKGINLSVAQGEFVALLGSSGCGKTTLLRTIAGFNLPSAGSIHVGGRDVTKMAPDKRGMALVFQSYALWPHMTVDQNIGYGLKIRGADKASILSKTADITSLLGLQGLGRRKPSALSGGQRQRVALGRALAIQPDILLLDEPLSNLDARIRLTVRHEISALQRRLGITAIHVTHDREEAMVMADRIVILNAGEIAQAGTPEEVYNRPGSDFVAAFMGAENLVEAEIVADQEWIWLKSGPFNQPSRVPAGNHGLTSGDALVRFRSEAASMIAFNTLQFDSDNDVGLLLTGIVEQTSYPGGIWRHMVGMGTRHVIVDSRTPFEVGTRVAVRVPSEETYIFPVVR